MLHLLVPTTDLAERVPRGAVIAVASPHLLPLATGPHPAAGVVLLQSFFLGRERYRYPQDLPKVAPRRPAVHRPAGCRSNSLRCPWVADIGTNQAQYGNQGILLNPTPSSRRALRPDRRAAAQQRTDRDARMSPHFQDHPQDRQLRVVMVLLTVALFAIFGQYRSGSATATSAVFRDASSLKSGDRRVACASGSAP